MDRGERRRRTELAVKRHLATAKQTIFGAGPDNRNQPHRLHKHKHKYTHDGSSLKQEKQKANRAARNKAKRLARMGEEAPPVRKKSVRWNYW